MDLIGSDGRPLEEDHSTEARSGVNMFSPSRISKFMGCQNQYREDYVFGRWGRPSAAMSFGTSVHKAIEVHCEARIRGESEPGLGGLKAIFSSEWQGKKENTQFTSDAEYDETGSEGDRVIEAIFPWIDSLKPRRVEFKVERKLPGRDYGVFGVVDIEELDFTIGDFKTASKSPSSDDQGRPQPSNSHMFQLLTYAFAITGGEHEVPGKVSYIVRKKKPVVVEANVLVTPEMMTGYIRQADVWIQAIKSATLYPPNRNSMLCSAQYCNAWKKCHEEY